MAPAARSAATGLAVFALFAAACSHDVYGGREDVAAEAGQATLTPEQLAEWVSRVPSGRPTRTDAGFVALTWVDYTLLAEAAASGQPLTDSATAAAAMAPDLVLLPLRRWHDTLVQRRPRVAADRPDSLYAGPVRVFQQIFLPVRDPQDVRAITAMRESAESLLTQVRGGASFDSLARARSADLSARNGGYLPPARRGAFPPEFERGAWRIEPGGLSGVITRGGFHIVRRPLLEEVREPLRVYAESLATRHADSVYTDSLVAAQGLALGQNVAARVRAFFNDPAVRSTDTEPLATWQGGSLDLAQASVWIDLLPPRGYLQLRGTSDVLLERFVREVAQQQILYEDAARNGIGVTAEEWVALYDGYRRSLAASLAFLGADSTGRIPAGQAQARVADLINRLTSDSTRWRPLPSALGAVLRARAGYRLHEPGLNRAARLAAPADSGTGG